MKSSKKAICLFVGLVMAFSAVTAGCSQSDNGEKDSSVSVSSQQSSEQKSEQPSEQLSETTESSDESTQSSAESSAENSAETSKETSQETSQNEPSKEQDPQPEIPDIDSSFFKRTAFLGNSITMGLDVYNIVTEADFYCHEGLTVYGVLHDTLPKQKLTVIEQLIKNRKKYDKVFLMFGTNETGLYDKSEFIEDYSKIIDTIKEKMPDVKIYIQSILPITAKKSKENKYNLNNEQINIYNKQLKDLAKEKDVPYLDVASVFKNKNGTLPESWTPDGVHLNPDYYYLWADYIIRNA
ncbi:MAG: GDSL-type esterase/lipase family protein [Acutalibacteraceae bacterium]